WNPSKFDDKMLLVGCIDGSSKIFTYNENFKKWQHAATLEDTSVNSNKSHASSIHDCAWAPSMGRSYNLLATASKDGYAKIWKLFKDKHNNLKVVKIAQLADHNAEVWKVEWNITGTVLATSGDDGTVRMWKCILPDQTWKCIS